MNLKIYKTFYGELYTEEALRKELFKDEEVTFDYVKEFVDTTDLYKLIPEEEKERYRKKAVDHFISKCDEVVITGLNDSKEEEKE